MPITEDTSTFADDTAFLSVHEDHELAGQKLQTHIDTLEK